MRGLHYSYIVLLQDERVYVSVVLTTMPSSLIPTTVIMRITSSSRSLIMAVVGWGLALPS